MSVLILIIQVVDKMRKRTCDDLELVDITDLRAVAECLAADPGIGEGPSYGEVEVVGPGLGREPVLQAVVEHVDPQLPGGGVHVGGLPLDHLHFVGAGATEGFHVDDNPLRRLRLPLQGVAVAPGRNREGRGGAHLPHVLDGGRDVRDFLGVEDGPRERVLLVAEVAGGELVAVEGEVAVDGDWDGEGEGEGEFEKHAAA